MDRFGVSSPRLKAKAERPEIPVLIFLKSAVPGTTRTWLGATLKNVETPAEQSAAGLSEMKGVLVLEVGKDSVPPRRNSVP